MLYIEQYGTSLYVVIQTKTNIKLFLVVTIVFFDSNSQRINFDIFVIHATFLFQSGCGSLGASAEKNPISTQTTLSKFPDERVKSIMWTSDKIDFRLRLKLKIT